ncbi:MAG TPA: site-specific integrase [Pseudonocardiaceae bacterium]|nr:site-specific integrase [Pseudonocardiaceae bacterium]
MTGLPASVVPVGGDLATRLRSLLRAEFAAPVILVDPSDPVTGGLQCVAAVCDRVAVHQGMCNRHYQRWVADGRPHVEAWAASVTANTRWLQQPRNCSAPSCRRALREHGFCHSHAVRWAQAGRPERDAWIAAGAGGPLPAAPACAFPTCALDAEGTAGLCEAHRSRWIRHGRPPVEQWIEHCMLWGRDRFDLRALPTPMRWEIAYAIQRRVDERRTKTRPESILRLLRALPRSGATSLLDRAPEEWTTYLGYSSERGYIERRFLFDAISYLHDLIDGVGWDEEYPRDVWLLRRLGYPGRDGQLRFDGIEASWLRALTKRWIRWRLSTGISVGAVRADIRAITLFAQSFPSLQRGPQALSRELIEAHLAHLASRFPAPKTRTSYIGAVAGLLRATRQHGWEPLLDAHVDVYREDYPRLQRGHPRALSEAVMTQLEHPDNLAQFKDPRGRLLARILMSTGLRVGDGCKLALDCIVRDVHGAPYLHYTNHKMRREAFVPIDTDLAETITEHQQAVLAELPSATFLLPRPTRNPDGQQPFSTATFRGELVEWLRSCDIRDELGKPVRVTPHQWRHTFGTRLINNEVPQETVRRLMDHSSHQMTALYAVLSDTTIREHWERARKVNINGQELPSDSGPLAEAVWMKNNLARAKMALPNGYCTLPLQQSCQYANACLTCPVFVTTAEFLPEHQRQLEATRTLINQAKERGQARVVEMNRTVETNLLSIITSLATETPCSQACATGCACDSTNDDQQVHHVG